MNELVLEVGRVTEHELRAGTSDTFHLRLAAGQYVRLLVDQVDVDVLVRVYGLGSAEWIQNIDDASGWPSSTTGGFEVVVVVARDSGTYRLEVRPSRQGEEGRYRIRIAQLMTEEEHQRQVAGLRDNDRVRWLRANAVAVRSVSPADEEFSDLEPLTRMIGSARVVLLGEAVHSHGTTGLAKTRIIKFLHQRLGFDVLAFEAPLYDASNAWDLLAHGEDAVEAIRAGLYNTWTYAEQFQPLIDYLGQAARTDRPLVLSGFDSQFTGRAPQALLHELAAFLGEIGIRSQLLTSDSSTGVLAENLIVGLYWPWVPGRAALPDAHRAQEFRQALRDLRAAILAGSPADHRVKAGFWAQVLESLAAQSDAVWGSIPAGATRFEDVDWVRYGDLRDAQMARNLLWLANEHFERRKLIVWTASGHAVRNVHEIESETKSGVRNVPMGHHVWEVLGSDAYVLAFHAYEGTTGYARSGDPPRTLVSDQRESIELEELMNAADLEYAVIDLRHLPADGAWLHRRIYARVLGHAVEAIWPQHVDGLFFIRTMSPSSTAAR